MMYRQAVCCCLFILNAGFISAEPPPTWRARFDTERRQELGPLRYCSLEDVKRFYALEGENRSAAPQPVDPEWLLGAPDYVAPLKQVAMPVKQPRRPSRTEPSQPRRTRQTSKVPLNELMKKSRDAYANGQLDDARRYYGLVLKADPNSSEALLRLQEIDRQMN